MEINLQGLTPSYSVLMLSRITRQLFTPPPTPKAMNLSDWRAKRRRRKAAKPSKLLSNWG